MARKKSIKTTKKEFTSTPFSQLKGVSVTDSDKKKPSPPPPPANSEKSNSKPESFYAEMAMLGVKPLDDSGDEFDDVIDVVELMDDDSHEIGEEKFLAGDDLFIAAMQDIEVRFSEPDYEEEPVDKPAPEPRRMKQLRQGRISPEASLDLHGLTRAEVAGKLKHFIQDARYQGWQTVLVITGRGLHSQSGEAVLRQETEDVIRTICKKDIAEWGYAPQRYGGKGAIVLFLKNKA